MFLHPSLLVTACLFAASVQATTWQVSLTGSDQAAGTAAAPFRTIQHAAEMAQPGDEVVVAPGVYRERVAPPRGGQPGLPIVFRSQVLHGAIVRGSDVWQPAWQRRASQVWSGVVAPSMFTDTTHRDGANPFAIPSSSTPYGREGRPEVERKIPQANPQIVYSLGQVFVDGELYEQAPLDEEMLAKPRTWAYAEATQTLSIHFSDDHPSAHRVEITTRRRLFAPHLRQLRYVTIEGFVFEHCGNQYPTNFWQAERPAWQQAGAVGTRSGQFWVIRNNIIRFANGLGLDLGNEGAASADLETGDNGKATGARGHLVEGNVISDNGAAGTASFNGSDLIIRGNTVERNNLLRFTGVKRWESAGIKLHNPARSVIADNIVRDNYGRWGIWCDGGAGQDTRITGNVIIRQGVGLDFEIGLAKPSLVEGNIFIENEVALGARESGGLLITRNLFVGSRSADLQFSVNVKRPDAWSAARVTILHNLCLGSAPLRLKINAPTDLHCEDRQLDGNVYEATASEARFALAQGKPLDFGAWTQAWQGFNGPQGSEGQSRLVTGNRYSFDAAKGELSLFLNFDPALQGGTYKGLRPGAQVLKVFPR